MKGLLLVAHGSRKEDSNDEIRELSDLVKHQTQEFEWADCAFLELTDPKVEEKVKQASQAGVTHLTVYPHFLAAGYHVATDLPEMLINLSDSHPDMSIHLIPHLGQVSGLAQLIVDHTENF